MQYLFPFLVAFAMTVAAEAIVVYVWFRQGRFVYYTFLCNLLTNPALNLVLFGAVQVLGGEYYVPVLLLCEVVVVLVEAAVLRALMRVSFGRALGISLVLNLASLAVGMLFRALNR